MKIKFRYGRADGRVWLVTILSLLLFAALCLWLFMTAEGAYYLAVWTTAVGVLLAAFVMLSIPRRIIIHDEELELRCWVETTYISLGSIVDVEVVGSEGFRGKIPLLGVYGFWGYYGRYLDLRRWRIHKVYAKRRSGCVAIHTSRERYLVSCGQPQMLRTMILEARSRAAKES